MTQIRSVAVFCGSKTGSDPAFEAGAKQFGRHLASEGIRLVYGGGGIGLMGAVADAVLDAGGEVTGIIPKFLMDFEVGHAGLTDMEVVDSMHIRKARMAELSDGFVMLPGGIGTLDETIEIITWKQLRLHDKPIVVVDQEGYWQPFEALLKQTIIYDFAHPKIEELYSVVSDVADILPALRSAPDADDQVLTSHL